MVRMTRAMLEKRLQDIERKLEVVEPIRILIEVVGENLKPALGDEGETIRYLVEPPKSPVRIVRGGDPVVREVIEPDE